jgi:hypothetical protein
LLLQLAEARRCASARQEQGARIGLEDAAMPTFPEWWNWDLSFTSHAELRMEQRGVTVYEVSE